jgi:uncharacterized membrane protein YedE/YeeE
LVKSNGPQHVHSFKTRASTQPQCALGLKPLLVVTLLPTPLLLLLLLLLPLPAARHWQVSRAALGGLLVGLGAALGNGCTSGHGICGNARLSPRSMLYT